MARGTHICYLHATISAAIGLGCSPTALGQSQPGPRAAERALGSRVPGIRDDSDGERSYRSATGLLNRGMHELAAAEYRAFLEHHASDAKAATARYGLAVCLFKTGNPREAAKELDRVLTLRDFEFIADAVFLRAQCAVAAGEHKLAADLLAGLARDHPSSALGTDALMLRGESLYRVGDREGACEVFKSLGDRGADSPGRDRADLIWSLADQAQGRLAAAADRLQSLQKRSPRGEYAAQAALAEAQCRHGLGSAAAALPLYRAALAGGTDAVKPLAMLGIGQLERAAGRLDEAARVLDDLIRTYGSLPIAAAAGLERGRVHFDAAEYDRALASFSTLTAPAAESESGSFADEAVYRSAQCELRLDRFDAAASRLDTLLTRASTGPFVASAMFDRAWALQRAGKDEPASLAFSKFRDRFPDHALAAEALAGQASLAHRAGHFDQCAELCAEFIKASPSHARAASITILLADSQYLGAHFADAAEVYGRFEASWPADDRAPHARARRGLSLLALGKPDEALPLLESALANPRGLDRSVVRAALAALGDSAFEKSDWPAAERWFAALLNEFDDAPAPPDAQLRLAAAIHRQGKLQDSVAAYGAVVTQHPSSAAGIHADFERAQAFVGLGDLKQARAGFERVVASKDAAAAKFSVPAQRHLAAIASREGRPSDAAALLAQVAASPDAGSAAADALLDRAQTLMSTDQYQSARASLEEFIARFPGEARIVRAKAQRAITLARQDKHEEAVAEIERLGPAGDTLDPALRNLVGYEHAWALRSLGRDEAAAKAYRTLLARRPGGVLEAHAALDLASIELRADHLSEALTFAKAVTAAADTPDSPAAALVENALYVQGVCEFRTEAWRDAAATLRRLIDSFPKGAMQSSANLMLGDTLLALGEPGAAAGALKDATNTRDPAMRSAALLRLGAASALAHRWKPSEEAYTTLLSEFSEHELWYQARFGVGWARENDGRPEAAIDAYREVVARHQGVTAAHAQFQVGECLFALGRLDEAARELMKVDILYAYPEWSAAGLYEAGRCFLQLGKAEEAKGQFRAVVEKYGTTEWAGLAGEQLATPTPAGLPGQLPPATSPRAPVTTKQ